MLFVQCVYKILYDIRACVRLLLVDTTISRQKNDLAVP